VLRIEPLEEPFEADVKAQLESMMPAGVPPIALFRTFAKNIAMTTAMQPWGTYELSRGLSLTMRDREIVIDRTCARCRCEYEWGVHVAFFADRVELTAEQVSSLTHGSPDDPCWESERERVLIRLVDTLHETSDVPDEMWERLRSEFDEAQLLDLSMLCGWYHAISFTARVARVPLEEGAPIFASVENVTQTSEAELLGIPLRDPHRQLLHEEQNRIEDPKRSVGRCSDELDVQGALEKNL
jgi:alkylhydroperoxidase family enzyme